jgi:hypothetical protein
MESEMSVRLPPQIKELKEGPRFEPKEHLKLTSPEKIWSLEDFGYPKQTIKKAPFPVAVTSPFRILSEKGLKALRESINALLEHRRESERMANFIRGGVLYSPFIRGLCTSPELQAFISELAGAEAIPHPMSLYQGHVNLLPPEKGREVDRWHTDTVALDFVLMTTDPSTYEGGHFEYFQCTKGQAIRAMIREEALPHIVKVEFSEPGMALLQQGNMVVHRANAVTKGDERTTLVQSFIPDSTDFTDVSKLDDCKLVDPHDILFTEWARYKAFLSQKKLRRLIDELPYTDDKNKICMELRQAIRDVEEAILEISDPSDGRLSSIEQDVLTDFL